ncbi:hypothetical protein [Nostoc sp.]|uniref:hypothetical protein n=1 Tax=Nostoc sp. TaxID=1180 RepID=UPI002FF57A7E
MTAVRFQADADLRQAIVTGTIRRQPDIDFQSAYAALLESKKDPEVLAITAQNGRVLVTHDRKTMPAEFGVIHNVTNYFWSFDSFAKYVNQSRN